MNIKTKLSYLAIITLLFAFSSCTKNTNKIGRYIPSDASFVLHLNGSTLNQKLPWDEVKNSEGFKKIMADTSLPESARKLLEDPASSGIDIKNNISIFSSKDSSTEYVAINGFLTNSNAFGDFLKTFTKNQIAITNKGDLKTGVYKSDAVSWNNDRFVFVVGKFRNPYSTSYLSDESDSGTVDCSGISSSLFNLSESKSLGSDKNFTEVVSDNQDIHFWINTEEVYNSGLGNAGPIGPLSMLNLSKFTDGARTGVSVNFENGRIAFNLKSFSSKEVTKLLKKYWTSKGNMDMIKQIPTYKLDMLVAFSFKPEFIKEYMKLLGVESMVNMGLTSLGFTLDDLTAALKGDFAIAINDFHTSDSTTMPDMKVLGVVSISNKTKFDKIFNGLNKFILGIEGSIDSTHPDVEKPPFYFNKNDNYFVAGNDQLSADTYLSGKQKSESPMFNHFSDAGSLMYININYLIDQYSGTTKDSTTRLMADETKKMWSDMLGYGKGYKGDMGEFYAEINLVNKNTNSLKQLNDYMNKMALLMNSKKQDTDSLPTMASMTPGE